MLNLIFLIVFVVVVLIVYHYNLEFYTRCAYWEGFWEGHALAIEDEIIARRLEEISESQSLPQH